MASKYPFRYDPVTSEYNDSLSGDYLWSNTNFGEAVTETMTPLTWAVIQFTLDDWEFLPGFATVGNIGGYPYVNISIFSSLFKALKRSRQQLFEMLEGTMFMQLPEGIEIPQIPLSRKDILISLLNVIRVQNKQIQGRRYLPAYLAHNPARFNELRRRIRSELSMDQLANLWHKEIRQNIKKGVWAVLGTANQSMEFTGRLQRDLISLVGREDASILISNVSAGEKLLPSLGPSLGLAKVVNGEISQENYLEVYGHRGPHEFELSAPRPAEDPGWLERQLAHYQMAPLDPQALFKKQQNVFDSAWYRFKSHYPRKANKMMHRIKENSHRIFLREQARSEYVRDRWLVRIFALRAGELTNLGNDIFFLTIDEMLGLLHGKGINDGLIASRQEIYHLYKALPSYPAVIRGRFDPFKWAADPSRQRSDFYDANIAKSVQISKIIKGAAGSVGCVEGLVRIMTNSAGREKFLPGEILVARVTDISWTPIFPRAAAVVTDVGAPLSHAAIVARELGIPAVVGCGNATMLLKTGDRVRVDGGQGTVEILTR